MTDTFETIRTILIDAMEVVPEEIGPDVALSDLALDSLAVVEFTLQLKDTFRADVHESDLRGLTIADLATLIDERRR